MIKIGIDAGHDNNLVGARGNDLKEEKINFAIASRVAFLLKNKGFSVFETRPTDNTTIGKTKEEGVNYRAYFMNREQVNLSVSIHCNGSDDASANGTEILVYKFGGEAEKVARLIQKEIVQAIGTKDRGVKEMNKGMVRMPHMPAILIECAFVSNKADAVKLATKQEDIAQAILRGILKHFNMEGKDMANTKDKPSEWAKEAWEWAKKNNLTDGTNPQGILTREQAIVLLKRMYDLKK